jgi:hypothetical protein
MQCLERNRNAKWGNGRLMAFFNATSRSRNTVADVCLSLGALRVSGGLLDSLCDADHQTLEEAFDEAGRKVT